MGKNFCRLVLATRLSKLFDCGNLEKAGCVLLEHFGKIKRPYLTPLEEQLLGLLEQESGVYRTEQQNLCQKKRLEDSKIKW